MQENKKTRGRPKGSNSFVKIKLSDLNSMLSDDTLVPISKIWFRDYHNVDVVEERKQIAPAKEQQPAIEFAITSFEQ